jgi:GntR family transcriptional regulator, phosphonate transport system regulatory protein
MTRTALWADIAATLKSDIAAGHYRPGDKLPTEADLSARFGVNRHTLRRALAALQDGGLVHSRRGAGVFVTTAPADYPLGRRVRFHQALTAAGRIPGREITSLHTRACDATEAEALTLTPGEPVHVVEGRSLADGEPIALFRSLFPATRLPDLAETLATEPSITRALALNGVPDYIRASTRLTAAAATATQAIHLKLPEGAPLLRSVAINTDPDGKPVEYGTTWFSGDRVTLTVSGNGVES